MIILWFMDIKTKLWIFFFFEEGSEALWVTDKSVTAPNSLQGSIFP